MARIISRVMLRTEYMDKARTFFYNEKHGHATICLNEGEY